MPNILQLNEFFVEGGDQKKSHVLLHITEPSTPEEETKGYFFAICEINNADNQYILKIQNIIDDIEQRYYEEGINESKHSLEIVLEKTNQENLSLKRESVELNCVVGIISHQEVIFSYHGRPQILLFYKNREGYYQEMNLSGNEDEKNHQQIFSQIIQGKISTSDFLFLSTSRLADYFSHDRLQKIITSRSTKQSAEHLERVLAELKNGHSFGGLIVHINSTETATTEKRLRPLKNNGSMRSLDHLHATEENTASTLAPSMINKVNKKIQSIVNLAPHLIDKIEKTNDPNIDLRSSPTQIGSNHLRPLRPLHHATPGIDYRHLIASTLHFIWKVIQYLIQAIIWLAIFIWKLLRGLIQIFVSLFYLATNMGGRRLAILNSWGQNWRHHKEHFRNLPLPTKILFLISIILVIFFISSLVYINYQKEKNANEQQFADQMNLIKEKRDSAESYLIYNDNERAIVDLHDAQAILTAANCATDNHQVQCEEMTQQIEKLSLKVRKEYQANLELLYDWSIDLNAKPTGLIKINNKLVAYSQTHSDLLIFDLLTKNVSRLKTNSSISGFTAAAVPKENDYALLVFNKNNSLQYNPENNTVKIIDISYPNEDAEIAGLVIYNRKLYSLDKNNGQIYKHDNTKNGFSQGKIWIKDGNKINNGVDLTIDGDIFVLEANGNINKYNAGEKQPSFSLNIEPPLLSAQKIWTYNDLNYIYLLDQQNKRILVLNKDGILTKQLTNKTLVNPLGLVIEEANQTAYLLDQDKLYKINL